MIKKKTQQNLDEFFGIDTIQQIFGKDITSCSTFLDELPFCLWMHDENYSIVYANHNFKETFGTFQKQKCYQLLMGEENVCRCCLSGKTLVNMQPDQCKSCKRRINGYDINIFHIPVINAAGRTFLVKSSLHLGDPGIHAEHVVPGR